jgi:CDP-diacylglycerol--glycerol-3-phosphate 3-phosphatidyltransferase
MKQPPQKKVESQGLSDLLRSGSAGAINQTARLIAHAGLTPNGLSIIGFLLAVGAATLAASGKFWQAGLVYFAAGPFDVLDGAVARVTGKTSPFGAVLDSVLDRYGEGILLTAIGYALAKQENWIGFWLAFTTLIGAMLISYVRARSEGVGLRNSVGILTRFERLVIMYVMLFTGLILPGLAVLSVLTHVTVIQRLVHVHRLAASSDHPTK